MKKKTVLITWWTWYIWSHIALELIEQWFEIALIDNLQNSDEDVCTKIHNITWSFPDFYRINLTDNVALERVFNFYPNIVGVIHCANAKVINNNYFPIFSNNIEWTLNLLTLMEKFNIKNFVYASSHSIYSDISTKSLIKETQNLNPSSTDWTTKLIIEKILKDISINKWFNCLSLRLFNVIWSHVSWQLWDKLKIETLKSVWNWSNILHNIFSHIDVWRSTKFMSNNVLDNFDWLDFVDINDVAKAFTASIKYLNNITKGDKAIYWAINIGNSVPYSLDVLIKKVEKVLWVKVVYNTNNDNKYFVCDNSRAKKFLPWIPTTTIESSLLTSWDSYQKDIEYYSQNWLI